MRVRLGREIPQAKSLDHRYAKELVTAEALEQQTFARPWPTQMRHSLPLLCCWLCVRHVAVRPEAAEASSSSTALPSGLAAPKSEAASGKGFRVSSAGVLLTYNGHSTQPLANGCQRRGFKAAPDDPKLQVQSGPPCGRVLAHGCVEWLSWTRRSGDGWFPSLRRAWRLGGCASGLQRWS